MAKHHPSRAFRLTASLTLSALYFVLAVGIWAVQEQKLGITADLPVCQAQTENFEALADGTTAIPDWTITGKQTVTVKSGTGNPGKGLELKTGSTGDVIRPFALTLKRGLGDGTTSGTVSVDVLPTEKNSGFTIIVRDRAETASLQVRLASGKIKTWQPNERGRSFIEVGSFPEGQYVTVALRWSPSGGDVLVGGTKVNPQPIPYDLLFGTTSPGAITTLELLAAGGSLSGRGIDATTFFVDNIRMPICSGGDTTPTTTETKTVNFDDLTTGTAVTNQFETSHGVLFASSRNNPTIASPGTCGTTAEASSAPNFLTGPNPFEPILLTFSPPVDKVTFQAISIGHAPVEMVVRDTKGRAVKTGQLQNLTGPQDGCGNKQKVELQTGSLIRSVELSTPSAPQFGDGFGIDDVTVSRTVAMTVSPSPSPVDSSPLPSPSSSTVSTPTVSVTQTSSPTPSAVAVISPNPNLTTPTLVNTTPTTSSPSATPSSVLPIVSPETTTGGVTTPTATTQGAATTEGSSAPSPTIAGTLQLVATGGSLVFNLVIAALLALITTYLFMRRHAAETEVS